MDTSGGGGMIGFVRLCLEKLCNVPVGVCVCVGGGGGGECEVCVCVIVGLCCLGRNRCA